MKDNFSKQAGIYAKYRPNYPKALFDFILQHVDAKKEAWDCATGNGQSAKMLAPYFEKVYASDISQKQIDKAEKAKNIFYSVQSAQQTSFSDNEFDLVTVAQALHWFATEEFYKEVKRVSKPHAVFVAWAYSLLSISPEIDKIIRSFYTGAVGPYWDAERKYVDEEYKTILFPFAEMNAPAFSMEYYWSLDELEGYINTWSALQKYIAENGANPVPDLIERVRPYWNGHQMKVLFPLHIKMTRIEK